MSVKNVLLTLLVWAIFFIIIRLLWPVFTGERHDD